MTSVVFSAVRCVVHKPVQSGDGRRILWIFATSQESDHTSGTDKYEDDNPSHIKQTHTTVLK